MKAWLVEFLETLCDKTHWLFHHRPLVWLPGSPCRLSNWSDRLDQHWSTGVWKAPE